jgi:peptide/nickel transport system substrate-binding protein
VVGLDAEPRSLDPHTTTASSDFRVLVNVYEGLVKFASGSLRPEPALAKTWRVSGDGKIYTFTLKPGVRFHDGTPLDAQAIKFNFDRMLDKEHPYHQTGPFPLAFFFDKIARTVVVDPLSVRFELKEAFAPLLANLAYPSGLIVSPSAIKRWGRGVGRAAVGSGPFRFAGWDAGQRLVLERNDAYHGIPAQSERIVFRPIADPMTRVAELRAGHVDLVPELSPDNVAWFRQAAEFSVLEASGPHLWFLILNLKKPPLTDVRVRRALNLAVDKNALVHTVLQNTASVAAGPIAAAFGKAAGNVEPYAYDPERARALLREAGVVPGQRLTLAVPESGSGMLAPIQMATVIQANLKAVGIDVSIESYEWNSYLSKVNAGLGALDMAAMAWMTNDPDTLPFLALRSQAQPPAGFNSGWYENAEVDALLTEARRQTVPAERDARYAEVQRLVHDDAPWLFVASWKQNVVTHREVRGLSLEPSFLLLLSGVGKL